MPETATTLLLNDYPVITERAVNWRDVDPALHVNNTKYLEWAETGRLDYFQQYFAKMGGDFSPGIGPVIAAIHCKYLFPLNFPDRVLIGTRLSEMGVYKYVMEAAIVSVAHKRIVAKARAKMVLFNFSKEEKVPLPEKFIQEARAFEAKEIVERKRSLGLLKADE